MVCQVGVAPADVGIVRNILVPCKKRRNGATHCAHLVQKLIFTRNLPQNEVERLEKPRECVKLAGFCEPDSSGINRGANLLSEREQRIIRDQEVV